MTDHGDTGGAGVIFRGEKAAAKHRPHAEDVEIPELARAPGMRSAADVPVSVNPGGT
jgi:hypothetical protein